MSAVGISKRKLNTKIDEYLEILGSLRAELLIIRRMTCMSPTKLDYSNELNDWFVQLERLITNMQNMNRNNWESLFEISGELEILIQRAKELILLSHNEPKIKKKKKKSKSHVLI